MNFIPISIFYANRLFSKDFATQAMGGGGGGSAVKLEEGTNNTF